MQNLMSVNFWGKAFKQALKRDDLSEARKLWEQLKTNDEILCQALELVVGRDGKMAFWNTYVAAAVLMFAKTDSQHFFNAKERVLKNTFVAARTIEIRRECKLFLELLSMREDVKLNFYEKRVVEDKMKFFSEKKLIGNFKLMEDVC